VIVSSIVSALLKQTVIIDVFIACYCFAKTKVSKLHFPWLKSLVAKKPTIDFSSKNLFVISFLIRGMTAKYG
jgi:hypothetical protein